MKFDIFITLLLLVIFININQLKSKHILSLREGMECPDNCLSCVVGGCTECKSGFYGYLCSSNCSKNCIRHYCDMETGYCECKKGYYGELCEKTCLGCKYGCYQNSGECTIHVCNSEFYEAIFCNNTCSSNCVQNLCDDYTGECVSCNDGKWGKQCENVCDEECKFDKRLDCCYAKNKNDIYYKNVSLPIFMYSNNKTSGNSNNNNIIKMNFKLGSKKVSINALVDFDSQYPLVVLDKSTEYVFKSGKFNVEEINYASEESDYFSGYLEEKTCIFNNLVIKGNHAEEHMFLEKVNMLSSNNDKNDNYIEVPINFVIAREIIVDSNFDINDKINAIIGMGFSNQITDDLYHAGLIDKNLISLDYPRQSIIVGDYSKTMKVNFLRLSTIIPTDSVMNDFKANLRAIAFDEIKAYKIEHEIKIGFGKNTSFSLSKATWHKFFDKIYFKGSQDWIFMESKGEYICPLGKQIKLKKFGLIINDFVYYLPQNLLFSENRDGFYHFNILLSKQNSIILGKEFLDNLFIVLNSGNKTMSILSINGDTKRADNLTIYDSIDVEKENHKSHLLPSNIALICIFTSAFLIMIIYVLFQFKQKKYNKNFKKNSALINS